MPWTNTIFCMTATETPNPGPEDRPLTVLVAEDHESVRSMAVMILEHLGYRVLQAGSGTEALKIWEDQPEGVDLLFTDLQMPGMTGLELAAALEAKKPGLKILFTSGSGSHAVETMLSSRQRLHFLPKPYTPAFLAAAINKSLGDGVPGHEGSSGFDLAR